MARVIKVIEFVSYNFVCMGRCSKNPFDLNRIFTGLFGTGSGWLGITLQGRPPPLNYP